MAKADLTAAQLRELVSYDPETGVFVWLRRPSAMFATQRGASSWNAKYPGKRAGSANQSNRYETIRIFDCGHYAHRLAWLYMNGEMPKFEIDHKDGNGFNNKYSNLRDVNSRINSENLRQARKSKKKYRLGVYEIVSRKLKKPFTASIKVKGKAIFLGYFETEDQAYDAYLRSKRELHEGCTI